jgi:ABC-type antimicrobial peptide transport system permease subunit
VWEVGCLLPESVVIDEKSREEFVSESLDEYLDGLGLMAGEVMGVTTSATTVAGPVRLTASSSTASASLAADTEVASASAMLFETVVATDSSGIEWVELKKVEEDKNKVEKISYRGSPVAEAYISSGMVKLLGLSATEAVGKVFKIYYIVPDSLMSGKTGRMQSEEAEYTVSGVIEDQNSSYFYYQISDAKRLGVSNYSQIKVVAQNEETLLVIRKAIETLGFRTTSTADTVAGIEKIFASLRLVLGFLGTIALAVASLGMFNTMTVSLLERTREVGVMKAMGMLSEEVRELFLAESMIMGVGGGTFGVVFGFVTGKLISFVLTTISVMKGQGTMDISYVPWFFVAFIMLVSFVVGILTGWYPSKRARAISALNALRYE